MIRGLNKINKLILCLDPKILYYKEIIYLVKYKKFDNIYY